MHEVQVEIKVEEGNLSMTTLTSGLDWCSSMLTSLLASILASQRSVPQEESATFERVHIILLSCLNFLKFSISPRVKAQILPCVWSPVIVLASSYYSFSLIPLQPPSPPRVFLEPCPTSRLGPGWRFSPLLSVWLFP